MAGLSSHFARNRLTWTEKPVYISSEIVDNDNWNANRSIDDDEWTIKGELRLEPFDNDGLLIELWNLHIRDDFADLRQIIKSRLNNYRSSKVHLNVSNVLTQPLPSSTNDAWEHSEDQSRVMMRQQKYFFHHPSTLKNKRV